MENTLTLIKTARAHCSGSSRDWPDQIVLDKMISVIENGITEEVPVEEVEAEFRRNRIMASSRNRYGEAQAWDIYTDFFKAAIASEFATAEV